MTIYKPAQELLWYCQQPWRTVKLQFRMTSLNLLLGPTLPWRVRSLWWLQICPLAEFSIHATLDKPRCLCCHKRISLFESVNEFLQFDFHPTLSELFAPSYSSNSCKLSSSTFSCQTINNLTNEILWTFLSNQWKSEKSYWQCWRHFE